MKNTLLVTTFLLLLSVGAYMDYNDEQDADNRYSDMVCNGHWPDYDNKEPDCP